MTITRRSTRLPLRVRALSTMTLVVTVLATGLTVGSSGAAARLSPAPAVGACVPRLDSIPVNAVSGELVTVLAPTTSSRRATLDLYRRSAGCWRRALGPYPAFVGVNGLSSHHREGDGTTPTGLFAFGATMYGALTNPGVAYRYHRLTCGDWWNENPRSGLYNEFVHVACGVTPDFARGSEALWTEVPAYDYFAVIDYNTDPVVDGRGSGIFLHVSHGAATTGCVSIGRSHLVAVLQMLLPSLHPTILITTTAGFDQLRRPGTSASRASS